MRKYIYPFYILFFMLSFIWIACKEDTLEPELSGTIQGTVLDEQTGASLSEVLITTSPASNSVLSDSYGKFQLTNLTVGTYAISASKYGYQKTVVSVIVKSDKVTIASIMMKMESDDNSHPKASINPIPQDKAININPTLNLSWQQENSNKYDTLKYDIFLYNSNLVDKIIIAENYVDTVIQIKDLDYNTTYFWQVITKTKQGKTANSNVWSFRTMTFPDNPIYYVTDKDGSYEIYSIDSISMSPFRITNNSFNELNPRINNKKNLIAFSSSKDLQYYIYTITKQGKELNKISEIPIAGFHNNGIGFGWSPDGSYLIYPNYNKLYKVLNNGGIGEIIATAPSNRNFFEASWNSTGDKIIALTIGQNFYDSEIYIMNSDGSGITLLVDNLPGAIGSPSFSPNGKKIMFTNDIDAFQDATNRQTNSHIFTKSLETGEINDISLYKAEGTNDLDPRFSPDGSKIVFTNCGNDGEHCSVWIMDSNGKNRKKIADNAKMPDWR